MPGIAGIISTGRNPENRNELDSMVQCMLHEKYYTSGTFVDEGLGLRFCKIEAWVADTIKSANSQDWRSKEIIRQKKPSWK